MQKSEERPNPLDSRMQGSIRISDLDFAKQGGLVPVSLCSAALLQQMEKITPVDKRHTLR